MVKLPTVAVPVALNVPLTLAPVPLTTNILALPALLILILPLFRTLILLVPFVILEGVINDNPPEPFVLSTCPLEPPVIPTFPTAPKLVNPDTVKLTAVTLPLALNVVAEITLAPEILPAVDKLPTVAVPDTDTLVSIPVLVIFG